MTCNDCSSERWLRSLNMRFDHGRYPFTATLIKGKGDTDERRDDGCLSEEVIRRLHSDSEDPLRYDLNEHGLTSRSWRIRPSGRTPAANCILSIAHPGVRV